MCTTSPLSADHIVVEPLLELSVQDVEDADACREVPDHERFKKVAQQRDVLPGRLGQEEEADHLHSGRHSCNPNHPPGPHIFDLGGS